MSIVQNSTDLRWTCHNVVISESNPLLEEASLQSKVSVKIDVALEREFVTPHPVPDLSLREVSALVESSKEFTCNDLLKPDFVQSLGLDAVFESFTNNYNISPQKLDGLKQSIRSHQDEAWREIAEKRAKYIFMDIAISLMIVQVCSEQELIEMDRGGLRLTPTAPSFVEALRSEKYNREVSKVQQCTICLEEFLMGVDVTTMPCSHLFHKECIRDWLKMTHTCPLCRFDLPTSD